MKKQLIQFVTQFLIGGGTRQWRRAQRLPLFLGLLALTGLFGLPMIHAATDCIDMWCPTNIVMGCDGPEGTVVTYSMIASNHCFPEERVYTSCTPPSGDRFSPGTVTVTCQAFSLRPRGTNFCTFTITVLTNCVPDPLPNGCLDLTTFPVGPVPNPWTVGDVTLTSRYLGGGPLLPGTRIEDSVPYPGVVVPFPGYFVQWESEILFASPCEQVDIQYIQYSGWGDFRAYDDAGFEIFPRHEFRGVTYLAQVATFVSPGRPIRRVVAQTGNAMLFIGRICCGPARGAAVSLTPLSPLGHASLSGSTGGGLTIDKLLDGGGVRIRLDDGPHLDLGFDGDLPAKETPSGASFEIMLRDPRGALIGKIRGVDGGDSYRTLIDFDAVGEKTYTAQFDLNGQRMTYANLGSPIHLPGQPARIGIDLSANGQLRVDFHWDKPGRMGFEDLPNLWWDGDNIQLLWAPLPQVTDVRFVDLIYSGIIRRDIIGFLPSCASIVVPADILVPCSPPGGVRVFYDAFVTNTCIRSSTSAICEPPSGTRFPPGVHTVECYAPYTAPWRALIPRRFTVTVSEAGSGCFLRNGSFEEVATAPPAGGMPFTGVTAWNVLAGEAQLFGAGAIPPAHDGTNYAALAATTKDGAFLGGTIAGRFSSSLEPAPLSPSPFYVRTYQASAWVKLARGSGVWIEALLSDGDSAHDQSLGFQWVGPDSPWRQVFWGAYPLRSFDRIVIRTVEMHDGRRSDGYVYVDDVRVCCASGTLVPGGGGTTSPDGSAMVIRWSGDGVLQGSASLSPNAAWRDIKLPMDHYLDMHRVVIPTTPNAPMMFFRLRPE